jgi:uncharacterized protein with von Willebrand factor type A (vWA) domain
MFGSGIAGGGKGMDAYAKLALWKKVKKNPTFMKVFDYLGAMLGVSLTMDSTKLKTGMIDISDVDVTDNILETDHETIAMLGDPDLELKILLDMAQGQLTKFTHTELFPEEEKGPVVFCIDNSGSMHGAPELYSKALALGCGLKALNQGRDFVVFHFSSEYHIDDIPTWYFPANKTPEIDKLMECMEYFDGGGTNFNIAIEAAIATIDKKVKAPKSMPKGLKEKFKKADIFFLSDGDCVATDEQIKILKEFKERCNAKIWSFWVDISSWDSSGTYASLAEFSDEIIQMSSGDLVHTSIKIDGISKSALSKV